MSRPEGLTDTPLDEVFEERYRENIRKQQEDRVRREGFEVPAFEVEDGELCERAVSRKIKNRWGTEPCGKPAMVALKFAGPQNPAGTRVVLCRGCIGWLAKDMIGHLDID